MYNNLIRETYYLNFNHLLFTLCTIENFLRITYMTTSIILSQTCPEWNLFNLLLLESIYSPAYKTNFIIIIYKANYFNL